MNAEPLPFTSRMTMTTAAGTTATLSPYAEVIGFGDKKRTRRLVEPIRIVGIIGSIAGLHREWLDTA